MDNTNTNEPPTIFMCPHCAKAFLDQDECYQHLETNHDTNNPYKCSICLETFDNRRLYTNHLKSVHKKYKPFDCPDCKRTFNCHSNLQRHAIIHVGVKPFTCSICTKSFSQKISIKKHLYGHREYTPYKCSKCPKIFLTEEELGKHVQRKHSTLEIEKNHLEHLYDDASFKRRWLTREKRRERNIQDVEMAVPVLKFLNEQLLMIKHYINAN